MTGAECVCKYFAQGAKYLQKTTDFNDPGNVQVRVFDDRLEVWSPGLLPKELDVRTIGKEDRSIPRNRKLTEIFHALGLIEGWGSGFARMIQWSRDNGNGDPVFKESAGAFVIEDIKV